MFDENMKQGNMEQGNTEQGNMEQGNMEQGNMEQGNTEQGNTEQGNMEQGNMKQGNMEQGNMEQGNMEQEITEQGNMLQENREQSNTLKKVEEETKTEQSYGEIAPQARVYSGFYHAETSTAEVKEPAKKKKGAFKKGVLFTVKAAVFGLIAGGVFFGVNQAGSFLYPDRESESESTILVATTNAASYSGTTVTDVSDVVEEVMPAIVSVVSSVSTSVQYGPFYMGTREFDSSGSGIIVGQSEEELLIVTNNHVIEAAKIISVTFSNANPSEQSDDISVEAILKGASAENDLAVLAIPLSNIPEEVLAYIKVATLGDSDSLRVGEGTIAIGNALGYGQSVTTGCVSALNREITVNNLTLNTIQTDAAINSGNSGGALLNMHGEVIGINSAKYSADTVEGMGYAIPISSALDIINELMNRKTRAVVDESERAYLGISGVDIDASYAKMYGIPSGISIQQVMEGSAAEEANLQKYDIITKFDGQSVSGMEDLKNIMQYYKAGETVVLTIQYAEGRNQYTQAEVEVRLGQVPE